MSDHLNWIQDEIRTLQETGLFNRIRTLGSPQGAWLTVDGKRVLNFCSNNYLGLANDPRLVAAAISALQKYGVGPGAVRSIAGTMEIHLELERRIAKFKGVESAIALQSGFAANLAAIPALVAKEDVLFTDELNHASIIDGCRLSSARIVKFLHANAADLERVIKENAGTYRRALCITDGVFSMDGDIAPLDEIYEVTNRHDVMLAVDDAHGEGVIGRNGRGIVDHFNLHGKVDLEIGTFSKAFGVMGGVCAGSAPVIDWIRQRGRPFLFSSAATPADTAACIAAVEILETSSELVDQLWDNARYFKTAMKDMGFDTGVSTTPITPVMLGEASTAQQFSRELFEESVFAMPLGFPTVPKGKARIRVMISAAHNRQDLDQGLAAFHKIGIKLGLVS